MAGIMLDLLFLYGRYESDDDIIILHFNWFKVPNLGRKTSTSF